MQYQFGSAPGVACQDGAFTLCTALHTRHNHNLSSDVTFSDLVKDFDAANHKALMLLLAKFGAPPKFVHDIERMHKDMQIVLKIGTAKSQFGQGVGVRQGDCLSSLLFGILMMAFGQSCEQARNNSSMSKMHFSRNSNSAREEGQMISQKSKSKGDAFEVPLLLCVDDTVLIFSSRYYLEKVSEMAYSMLKFLGLEMHIGCDNVKSKTEYVFSHQ